MMLAVIEGLQSIRPLVWRGAIAPNNTLGHLTLGNLTLGNLTLGNIFLALGGSVVVTAIALALLIWIEHRQSSK